MEAEFRNFVIFLIGCVVIGFYLYKKYMPRESTIEYLDLDKNAKITDIKTDRVYGHLETTVSFSDGYRYTTRECTSKSSLGGYITYYVDDELTNKILNDAVEAHAKKCQKMKK